MAFPATSDGWPASGFLEDQTTTGPGTTSVAFKGVNINLSSAVWNVNSSALTAVEALSTAVTGISVSDATSNPSTTGLLAMSSDLNVTNGIINSLKAQLILFGVIPST